MVGLGETWVLVGVLPPGEELLGSLVGWGVAEGNMRG